VLVQNFPQFSRHFFQGLVPRNFSEKGAFAFQGLFQPVCVVLKVGYIQALTTDVPCASRVFLVGLDLDDPIAFDKDLQTAVLGATDTTSLMP